VAYFLSGMLVLVLVLVLKDSLRTSMSIGQYLIKLRRTKMMLFFGPHWVREHSPGQAIGIGQSWKRFSFLMPHGSIASFAVVCQLERQALNMTDPLISPKNSSDSPQSQEQPLAKHVHPSPPCTFCLHMSFVSDISFRLILFKPMCDF